MFSHKPSVAKKFAAHSKNGADLPEYVGDAKDNPSKPDEPMTVAQQFAKHHGSSNMIKHK